MGRTVLICAFAGILVCGWAHSAESGVSQTSQQTLQPRPSPAPFPLEWVRLIPTKTLNTYFKAQEAIDRKYLGRQHTKELWEEKEEELQNGTEPTADDIAVREEPNEESKLLGVIRVQVLHRIVSSAFQAEGSKEMVPFTPDLYLDGRMSNTVYCHDGHPYCHQTVTARQGDWVQMPPRPWSKPGWVNVKTFGLSIRPLGSGNNWSTSICPPYELDGKSFVIYGYTDAGLCVGPAGTASINNFLHPCERFSADAYNECASVVVSNITWDRLVDPDGRLRFKLAARPELKENVKLLPQPSMGWIGLFDPEWEEWLSEVNFKILGAECKDLDEEQYHKCRDRVLKDRKLEKSIEIPVYESPDSFSPRIGTFVIRADLDFGATGKFRVEGSDELVKFEADESKGRKWTYGIQFHQTYLDKKGTWYKLPANPLPKPGWIDISRVTETPSEIKEISGIFTTDAKQSIIVLGIGADGSGPCIRDETSWDYACGAQVDDAEITLEKVRVIHWKDLLDKDGHLTLHEEYTEGC